MLVLHVVVSFLVVCHLLDSMYVLSGEGISTFLLLHNILTWGKNTEKDMLKAIDKKFPVVNIT
jgi:hypothetical protein